MHTVRETDDLDWSDGELSSLGSSWGSLNSNNVTSSQRCVKGIEVSLIVRGSSHDLDFCAISLKVNEDQLGSSTSERLDSTSDCDCGVLIKLRLFSALSLEHFSELIDAMSA